MLGFQKVFVVVLHALIRHDLQVLNISQNDLCFLEDYLTSRKQAVSFNGQKSCIVNVTSDVT